MGINNELEKKKKIIKYVVAAGYPIFLANYATEKYKNNTSRVKILKNEDETEENELGFEVTLGENKVKLSQNNFAVLHVKKSDNIEALKKTLEMCEKNNVSVSIVLDTEAETLVQMYSDVDFLQAIITEYNIELPIYCNINNIMAKKNLNSIQKSEIIGAFCEKASRSGMYIGIYGDDTNLTDCQNHVMNIDIYDCFLVEDKKERSYQGTANIVKNNDGKITLKYNLADVIKNKNKNKATNLVLSSEYVVKKGETYHSLSLEYGLSESDLREYNDDMLGELRQGQVIFIPNLYSSYNKETEERKYNYAVAVGIDISPNQTKFDWERIKETSDFVIVEVSLERNNGTSDYLNPVEYQIKNVIENNLELGLYFCINDSLNTKDWESRIKEHVSKLSQDLEKYNIEIKKEDIPVFLDFEHYVDSNDYFDLMEIFDKVMKEEGYSKIGIYANNYTFEKINENMKKNHKVELCDTNWYIWLSGGKDYKNELEFVGTLNIDELKEIENSMLKIGVTPAIRQSTNVCGDTGAGNHLGRCDYNYLYNNQLFGEEFEQTQGENLIEGTIQLDLNDFKNYNVDAVSKAVENVFMGVYTAIFVGVVGSKAIFNLVNNKIKKLTKKK